VRDYTSRYAGRILNAMGSTVKSRISRVVCLISVASLAVAAAGLASAAPERETKRHPAVVVTNENPVVVAGRGFAARERVALSVRIGSRAYAKALRATPAGTFRATFAQADAQCQPYTVTAVGRSGSRAVQTRRFNIPPPCGIDPQD
jgi:hypothetical protein